MLPPGSLILIRGRSENHWFERYVLAQIEGPRCVFACANGDFCVEEIAWLWTSTWTWTQLSLHPTTVDRPRDDSPSSEHPPFEPVYGFSSRPSAALLRSWILIGRQTARSEQLVRGLTVLPLADPIPDSCLGVNLPAFAAVMCGHRAWGPRSGRHFQDAASRASNLHAAAILSIAP